MCFRYCLALQSESLRNLIVSEAADWQVLCLRLAVQLQALKSSKPELDRNNSHYKQVLRYFPDIAWALHNHFVALHSLVTCCCVKYAVYHSVGVRISVCGVWGYFNLWNTTRRGLIHSTFYGDDAARPRRFVGPRPSCAPPGDPPAEERA